MVRTVVMTGGSSGFGAVAIARLTRDGDCRVLLGTRSAPTDPAPTDPAPTDPGPVEAVAVDLARLDSVRAFAGSVRERLGATRIDSLVLNAGIVRPDDTGRTSDGFETTFAVNHLAHHLLLRLLLPVLADGAHVVLTTSGTHDPATGAALATPRHARADLLAHPDRDPGRPASPREAGQQAYTASKLCSVLTARALHAHLRARGRRASATAYDPGQVFGTGLARDLAAPLRVAWALLGTPVGAPLRRLRPVLNTRVAAGETLAALALDGVREPDGPSYAALRGGRLVWREPSELARSDDLAAALWRDSDRLAGVTGG